MVNNERTFADEMSARERLERYDAGETVDRIPVTMSLNESYATHYGFSLDAWYHDPAIMVEVEEALQRDFAFDNMGVGLGLRGLCEALGTKVKYFDNAISVIEKPVFDDYSQIDEERVVDIARDGRLPALVEALKTLIERHGKTNIISTGIPGPITTATFLIGTERFLKDVIKDKENIKRLVAYAVENYKACAKQMHDALGISIGMPEPMVSRDLMSLRQFRDVAAPALQETCDFMKDLQGSFSLHICGHTHDRWDELHDIGFDGFSMDNCESMKDFKEQFGSDMSISGNVPPVEVVRDGSERDIELAVCECLAQAFLRRRARFRNGAPREAPTFAIRE